LASIWQSPGYQSSVRKHQVKESIRANISKIVNRKTIKSMKELVLGEDKK
jgi:predicted component of type VI protein secretion system